MKLKIIVLVWVLQSFAMANNGPEAIVRQYFSHLESGNFTALMDLFADDVIWHQPGNNRLSGVHIGKTAIATLFQNFMEISLKTFKIYDISNIMVNGDLVVVNLRFSAHRCTYFDAGIDMAGIDLMRVVAGKIKEVHLFSEDQKAEDRYWGSSTTGSSSP